MATFSHASLDRALAEARASVERTLPARTLQDAGAHRRTALPRGANGRPLCRWCQLEITAARRRTFCSEFCVHQWRLRSDPGYLREQVFLRDRGVCSLCSTDTLRALRELKRSRGGSREALLAMWGLRSVSQRRSLWDADHILPVAEGGGQCDLENLRTLCLPCHREVTAQLRLRLRSAESPARYT
jgi:5-methylcytosine-specific restriction enzyme A